MKIALLTDTHWGARGDNQNIISHFADFYNNVFFPTCESRGVTHIIHLGDVVDRRKYINFYTSYAMNEYFIAPLCDKKMTMDIIVGNHDTFFKDTNSLNSPKELFKKHDNISIHESCVEKVFDGLRILFIPWITSENEETTLTAIDKTTAQVVCGHLELQGFEMHKGQVMEHGRSASIFKKFDVVYSGHFHHKSLKDNIQYLGTPYEMTWSDFDDPKGFHIFDTDTRSVEFIRNPVEIFHKITYDDTNLTLEDIQATDYTVYKNCYIRIYIVAQNNPYLFDILTSKLEEAGVADYKTLNVVELSSDGEDSELLSTEIEDTPTILTKYIENLNVSNKAELSEVMMKLYNESSLFE